ncbi:glycoside hydrolase family 65 protein [Embleya hyalina]|uniref:Family 65 glycosyl hydrolase n=1 Tax=Embleya hyalina TaxID=516124 RepID=A0A401YMK3_9ACTN|nr:glycosyl hydrolase family 65 protein [Embleya hyalina]GCD95844.1 family 65 glycosyl hydrolase [Embleya hyalina]
MFGTYVPVRAEVVVDPMSGPRRPPAQDPWILAFHGFDTRDEGRREALCALGNGYLVTRGAAPESGADGIHYPGTYLAGAYDRVASTIDGRRVENEDLINCPNWLPLTFRAGGAVAWFGEDPTTRIVSQRLELDLRRGVLTRDALVVDAADRRTRLRQRRLVSLAEPHVAALETVLTPENWSGPLHIRAALDGTVANTGVARYRSLVGRHLTPAGQGAGKEALWLRVQAVGSPLQIAVAARGRLHRDGGTIEAEPEFESPPGRPAQVFTSEAVAGRSVTVEKTVAVYTSRDPALGDPRTAALRTLSRTGSFDTLLHDHAIRWEQLWRRFRTDTEFTDRAGEDNTLHLHLFHTAQTYSEHTVDLDVGMPARGWHGEGYRGHVFWDELFVLRTLNLRTPRISRAVLRYRYRRLDAARRAAADIGLRGAMYPWQSAADGTEQAPSTHLNPMSGRWLPDRTHLQRHVGLAVAYNTWQYYQATGDLDFLDTTGAEMLLEIARFWADIARYDPALERYRIRGVMGPDEYHDAYPWADHPGIDDNTYTNVLASWVLSRALDALDALPGYRRDELTERLDLTHDELDRWHTVARRLHVPFHDGVPSQFAGYERLAELDWRHYRRLYPDNRRLDRILEAEGDSVNRYKASKQADVLMLHYLFPAREIRLLLRRLGYPAGHEMTQRTVDYYRARTVHGSTLSSVVHAWVLARTDRRRSWRFFRDALGGDVHDVQGGTTAEGIHLGAMAGTVDLVQRCYTGLDTRGDVLWLDPCLPARLRRLEVELCYRGHWGVVVEVGRRHVTVSLRPGQSGSVPIGIRGSVVDIPAGGSRTFTL